MCPVMLQAMGWLTLLLPSHGLRDQGCDAALWNGRLDQLMALLEAFSPSSWWSAQCLGLLARLAKHDRHGVLWAVNMLRLLDT